MAHTGPPLQLRELLANAKLFAKQHFQIHGIWHAAEPIGAADVLAALFRLTPQATELGMTTLLTEIAQAKALPETVIAVAQNDDLAKLRFFLKRTDVIHKVVGMFEAYKKQQGPVSAHNLIAEILASHVLEGDQLTAPHLSYLPMSGHPVHDQGRTAHLLQAMHCGAEALREFPDVFNEHGDLAALLQANGASCSAQPVHEVYSTLLQWLCKLRNSVTGVPNPGAFKVTPLWSIFADPAANGYARERAAILLLELLVHRFKAIDPHFMALDVGEVADASAKRDWMLHASKTAHDYKGAIGGALSGAFDTLRQRAAPLWTSS